MNTYEKVINDGIKSVEGYMHQIMEMGKLTGMYDLMLRIVHNANNYSVEKRDRGNSVECVTVESNSGHTEGSSMSVMFYINTTGFIFKKKTIMGYRVLLKEKDNENGYIYCKEYNHVFGGSGRFDSFSIKEYNDRSDLPVEMRLSQNTDLDKHYRCLRTLQVRNQICYLFDGIKQETVDTYDRKGTLVDSEIVDKYVEGEILHRQRRNITNEYICKIFETRFKTEDVEEVIKRYQPNPNSKYVKTPLFHEFKTYMSEYFDYMMEGYDRTRDTLTR